MMDSMRAIWLITGLLAAGAVPGCSKDDDGPTVRSVEGTVRAIEAEKSRVKLQFRSEDGAETLEEWGFVTPATEIKINGQISDIHDIKVGDRVQVMVQAERVGEESRYTAKKVIIQRDEVIRASQPPAESTSGNQ